MDIDAQHHIEYLKMIAPECLQNFSRCPNALLIDCTFKTNKYGMPLLNLVGSNGNNRTTHLGVVLMRRKNEASFCWVFNHLKAKFDELCIHIRVFITDNDGACINALNNVFNFPKIVMCRWHMNKDVLSYVRQVLTSEFGRYRAGKYWVDNESTKRFMELYYCVLQSATKADYVKNFAAITALSPTAAQYLN